METAMAFLISCAALALTSIAKVNAQLLPQGNSDIASRYPQDVGIMTDPAVIFADNFESYGSSNNESFSNGGHRGMRSQNRLRSVLRSKVQQVRSIWNKLSQDGRNLELVLRSTSSYLTEQAPVNDPLTYVKNLRNYIEPLIFKTTTVKDSSAVNNDRTILRFSELKRLLATNVPPFRFRSHKNWQKMLTRFLACNAPMKNRTTRAISGYILCCRHRLVIKPDLSQQLFA